MRNILTIASKELKSYFSSPVGWILLGFWSLLYGYFFVAILNFFVRQSMQMSQFGQAGPQAMNVNQQLLRPLIAQNLPILVLFLLPAVTMRTYSEERRSGTIELLLTSPLTDFQIIMGKFLGALALWVIMLLVSMIHLAILFVYARPALRPLASAPCLKGTPSHLLWQWNRAEVGFAVSGWKFPIRAQMGAAVLARPVGDLPEPQPQQALGHG